MTIVTVAYKLLRLLCLKRKRGCCAYIIFTGPVRLRFTGTREPIGSRKEAKDYIIRNDEL